MISVFGGILAKKASTSGTLDLVRSSHVFGKSAELVASHTVRSHSGSVFQSVPYSMRSDCSPPQMLEPFDSSAASARFALSSFCTTRHFCSSLLAHLCCFVSCQGCGVSVSM